VWILDGVEVTIVGAFASRLQDKQTLGLSAFDVAFGGTGYVIGAAIGAMGFGYLTDRLGRKKLVIVTLAVYLLATVATAFTWSAASFCRGRGQKVVSSIEQRVMRDTGQRELDDPGEEIEIEPREATNVFEIGRTLFKRYPRRSMLGFTLMATQAFIYMTVSEVFPLETRTMAIALFC
jgi:MFS family permease